MRIGAMLGVERGRGGLDAIVVQARELEERGFATAWLPHVFGLDAVTAAALVGAGSGRIEVGTAVVPSFPRHPSALAQQALTAGVACGGRFTLGLGLSHPVVIEGLLGLSYHRPARHMKEYLAVLAPLLRGEPASHRGECFQVELALEVPDRQPVPLLLAALGERMLGLAGRHAEGTILWMTGPHTIESHIVPTIRAAAREAGRPEPRIVAGFQIVLTSRPGAARERLSRPLSMYSRMPSYRAMLDKEGVDHPVELALVGDETLLDRELLRLRDLGVTDLEAVVVPAEEDAVERTTAYLASRIGALG